MQIHPSISAIKCFPVWVGKRNELIVKVETDDGIFGWGESGLSGREKAVIGAIEHFEQFLIGHDTFAIGQIWQKLYRSQYFEGGRVLLAAMSAIDIALHDIKARALGVPVHHLLGGKQREFVSTFATAKGDTDDAVIEQAIELVGAGWKAVRIFPTGHDDPEIFEPREHLAKTAKRCKAVREAVGDEIVLGIDFHHRLSVAEAASFCQKLPSGTLDFLEEPIRDEAPQAYEALRRLTDVPFAIGEEFASKWQFMPYIERDILQFNRIDVCNVGGLSEAMKVASWSEAHYVDMMPHNPLGPICTAATIHLSAAVPNFAWQETRTTTGGDYLDSAENDFFLRQPKLKGSHYVVDDTPGLGVEVNEDLLEDQIFKFWEPPHLHRRDGSVTNW